MKRGLGPLETTFFAYTHMRGMTTVCSGELLRPLQLTRAQERKILSRLAHAGIIARVRRGLYRFANGRTANADINGAANILRKSKQNFDFEGLCKGLLDSPLRIRLS